MAEIFAVLTVNDAWCVLPNGHDIRVDRRRVPLYDLARVLDGLGYGDWALQARTLTGTPSLRGKVSVMAGLTVSERDKTGLRLEKYRPFEGPAKLRGSTVERDQADSGTRDAA